MGELLEIGAGIPPLAVALAFMIPIAIAVYWYGNRRVNKLSGGLGRGRWGEDDEPLDEEFRAQVRRFQDRDNPGQIADAPAGLVMLRGVLLGADVNLGGAKGRECVWRNRADGRRGSAVSAEIVFFRDPTGQAALEGLERALVIAPPEKGGRSVEWVGLYLGDEIEVIGRFVPEPKPESLGTDDAPAADPSARIYGTLGQDGKLHVRLVRRPPPLPAKSPTNAPDEGAPESNDTSHTSHVADDPVDPATTSSTE